MMKKIILSCFVFLLALGLFGCGKSQDKNKSFDETYKDLEATSLHLASSLTLNYELKDQDTLVYAQNKYYEFTETGYELTVKTKTLSTTTFELEEKITTSEFVGDYAGLTGLDLKEEYLISHELKDNTLILKVSKDNLKNLLGIEATVKDEEITVRIVLNDNKLQTVTFGYELSSGRIANFEISCNY